MNELYKRLPFETGEESVLVIVLSESDIARRGSHNQECPKLTTWPRKGAPAAAGLAEPPVILLVPSKMVCHVSGDWTSSSRASTASILCKNWMGQELTTTLTKCWTPGTRRTCKSKFDIPTDKWHRWDKMVQPYDGILMYQKLQEILIRSRSSRVWVKMSAISNGVRYRGNDFSECMFDGEELE